jgi:hypothetical protein
MAEAANVNLVAHLMRWSRVRAYFTRSHFEIGILFVAISMLLREACDGYAIVFPTVVVF